MTGIILAHGKAEEAVARHRPNWLSVFEQVITVSPSDDPMSGSVIIGKSERYGTGCMERMMVACILASRFPVAAVLEYDALLMQQIADESVPGDQMFCSVMYANEVTGPDGTLETSWFATPTYGHCPWIATGETWWRILTAGADYQYGNPDRWLALACRNAGVEQLGTRESFSNDRDEPHWSDETIAQAVEAVRGGAIMVHGVKTTKAFDAIMDALTELKQNATLVA